MLFQCPWRTTTANSVLGYGSCCWPYQLLDNPWLVVRTLGDIVCKHLLILERPDHCDGTFDQYCDESRQYTNITQILQSFGATSLLSYMNTYWVSDSGTAESFWEHEWGKHGTCISTLYPKCYNNYTPQEEVLDFFNKTVSLFQTLNSYSVCFSSMSPSVVCR